MRVCFVVFIQTLFEFLNIIDKIINKDQLE